MATSKVTVKPPVARPGPHGAQADRWVLLDALQVTKVTDHPDLAPASSWVARLATGRVKAVAKDDWLILDAQQRIVDVLTPSEFGDRFDQVTPAQQDEILARRADRARGGRRRREP